MLSVPARVLAVRPGRGPADGLLGERRTQRVMDKTKRRAGRQAMTWAAAFALVGGGLAGGALAAAPLAAAQPGQACQVPVLNGATETVTCTYTGVLQYWTVPAGVSAATLTVYGTGLGHGQ